MKRIKCRIKHLDIPMEKEDSEAGENRKCAWCDLKRLGVEDKAYHDKAAKVQPEFTCEMAKFIGRLSDGRERTKDRSYGAELVEICANQAN